MLYLLSLRGRRAKGRERVKHKRMKCVRVGDACKDAIVFFILPLIKYPKPTHLKNVWLSKLSNQNHTAYLMAKSVGTNGCSHFFMLFFAREKKLIFQDLWRMEKAKRGRPEKENNCNDVCRVCQENLKATYGNRVAKSCVNILKPSVRKEI